MQLDRDAMFKTIRSQDKWDVVVIGGGATGLGTALDAASRGYRTIVLEANDFAKGTSSRSTKLIHGGVRYLRSGQVRMVRESLLERGRLLKNAPHIVHPMQFIVPSFRFGQRWYYWLGMKLYDFLAGTLNLKRSRILSKRSASDLLPTLRTEKLRGGVLYSDGQFDDARLALALAQTCVQQGGLALNYTPIIKLIHQEGKLAGVVAKDLETGNEFEVRARVVVNATGVFGEQVMAMDTPVATTGNQTQRAPTIVPSQGTHLVLDRDFLPTDYAIMIPETDDGRVLFAIPWHHKTLLGTTDHQVDEILPDPKPLAHEVDYLLEHAGRYLTRVPTRSDVRSVFAGLRPLVGKPKSSTKSGEQSTASLSREHEIYQAPSGLITIIGGKWTTYRKMGEDVMDLAAKVGELDSRPSTTANMLLVGAETHAPSQSSSSQPPESSKTPSDSTDPLSVFGIGAELIDAIAAEDPSLQTPLHERLPYTGAHVIYSARHEMARTVEDVLARRTRALLLDADASIASAGVVAELLRSELGKDEQWQEQQTLEFTKLARGYHVEQFTANEST